MRLWWPFHQEWEDEMSIRKEKNLQIKEYEYCEYSLILNWNQQSLKTAIY